MTISDFLQQQQRLPGLDERVDVFERGFVMWGMFIPFYYIPLFAIDKGIDSSFANALISILNVGSFVGRIVSGALADQVGR